MKPWRRMFAAVLLAYGVTACAGASPRGDGEELIPLVQDHPEAMLTPAWINPKTLQLHSVTEEPEDGDMVIKGAARGWEFTPVTGVIGALHTPPPAIPVVPCWLRLLDRTVHFPDAGGPPPPPYLPGQFDSDNGLFYPNQAEIVRSSAPPTTGQ